MEDGWVGKRDMLSSHRSVGFSIWQFTFAISSLQTAPLLKKLGFSHESDMLQMGDEIEAYVNQVNASLDVENLGMDEAMNTWYDAPMEEMNTMGTEPSF